MGAVSDEDRAHLYFTTVVLIRQGTHPQLGPVDGFTIGYLKRGEYRLEVTVTDVCAATSNTEYAAINVL